MKQKRLIFCAATLVVCAALVIFYFVLQEVFFPGYSPMVEEHIAQKTLLTVLFLASVLCCVASGITALMRRPASRAGQLLRYLPDLLFTILALFQIYYVDRISNEAALGLPTMAEGGSHYLYIVYLVVTALALQGCFFLIKRTMRRPAPAAHRAAAPDLPPASGPSSVYHDDDLTRGI